MAIGGFVTSGVGGGATKEQFVLSGLVSGVVIVSPVDLARVLPLPKEDRTLALLAANRTATLPKEDRTLAIED